MLTPDGLVNASAAVKLKLIGATAIASVTYCVPFQPEAAISNILPLLATAKGLATVPRFNSATSIGRLLLLARRITPGRLVVSPVLSMLIPLTKLAAPLKKLQASPAANVVASRTLPAT